MDGREFLSTSKRTVLTKTFDEVEDRIFQTHKNRKLRRDHRLPNMSQRDQQLHEMEESLKRNVASRFLCDLLESE